MQRKAVEGAEREFVDTVRYWTEAKTAKNFVTLKRSWSGFLVHANRVFTKLEQGAKKTGASSGWFGRIKHQRKNDPLLQYIHQARDASEHGDVLSGNDIIVGGGEPPRLYFELEALTIGGPPTAIIFDPPRLLPAKTRSGIYLPPTSHLGQQIAPVIEVVAEAMITYLQHIVTEAKSRIVEP